MSNLSDIITPTNIVTATSTTTMTNKTLVAPALGTPASGVMTSVTGLPLTTGVTGTLPVANGGTGATALTANNVVLGNGTSAVQVVAPSTSGNVLTSNGTTWASATPAAGGATSINGLSDGYNDGSSLGLGTNALANDDGTANLSTAVGTNAMTTNTTGYNNAAIGSFAMQANTTGNRNVAVGAYSLYSNTTSDSNTASGNRSMFDNTTGSNNAAYGTNSLENNTTGGTNTASGYASLRANTTGSQNTAFGYNTLKLNTTGTGNTAVGERALQAVTNITFGTAIGHMALGQATGAKNTASGAYALWTTTTGTNNTSSGYYAKTSSAGVSNEFILGNAQVSNLRCNVTSISSLSDERDKTNITDLPDSAGLGIINALRPVTFNWDRREWYDNNTPDGSKIMPDWRRWKANSGLKYGFIAQEVQATIAGEKCMADSMIVTDENLDKLEFAPQHLLTNAIKAIQQLSSENEALKVRLTALENA